MRCLRCGGSLLNSSSFNYFIMEKFISLFTMIICLMIMRPAIAQEEHCHLVGNHCEGLCGVWYWGTDQQNQQPKVAGYPECHKKVVREEHGKPVFECHCFLIVTATRCRDRECHDDGCPNVYASVTDAQFGLNPIHGDCISQETGNNPNCACEYEDPKK
jgi:hypothetical protein